MSTPINDGGPAFPCPVEFGPNQQLVSHGSFGMSLRDWFAGQALTSAAMMENQRPTFGDSKEPTYKGVATRAYLLADAMIAAR